MEDVMLQQTGSAAKKVSAESFEEVLGEIDKGIKKYVSEATEPSGFGANIGKENDGDHPCINESNVLSPLAHATLLSASPRVPLAKIPNSLVNHVHTEGTWKRLTRIGVALDVGMVEAVALNLKNPGLAPFGLLIQDSLQVSTGFSKLSYSHTKREGNTVAHNLAQNGGCFDEICLWEEVDNRICSLVICSSLNRMNSTRSCFHL
ncbi:hypothetical protein CMV_010629 [Castanea mollissima]|uniref:Uncharacterized protein n=1 Tax=Castanea mollissima TaxID=60419 RepID=A0A8J4VPV6_9ROSI|nr:hypothetical protein CMV_010629 [Castanea mollissima]